MLLTQPHVCDDNSARELVITALQFYNFHRMQGLGNVSLFAEGIISLGSLTMAAQLIFLFSEYPLPTTNMAQGMCLSYVYVKPDLLSLLLF